MNPGSSNDELRDLMLRHVEGDTSPEGTRRLALVLRNSPEAQREFAEMLVQVVQLRSIGAEQNVIPLEVAEPVGEEANHRSASGWRLAVVAAAAVCVFGLTAWACFSYLHHAGIEAVFGAVPDATASTHGVAVLTHCAGVVWAPGANADVDIGASLSPGRVRLKEGAMQLRFLSGAEVIVQGPAELNLVSGREAALRYGRLSAHVPPEARGFTVRSARTKIVDLGTDFGVSKPTGGSPLQLHVFSGRVQFSAYDGQTIPGELTTGEAVLIESKRLQPMRADRAAFLSEEQLSQREFSEGQDRYAAWKRASQALAADPATLVHLDFDGQSESDRKISNRARISAPAAGEILGCDWTQGRWPDKGALEFKKPADRVHLVVPGRFKSLTYLAWVRADGLPNFFNGLSLSERRVPGAVHWQMLFQGGLEFSVRVNSLGPENIQTDWNRWERLLSRPVVKPEHLGHWLHVAAVYDGPKRTMSVFLNGQMVQSKTIEHPVDLLVGDVGLGNWRPMDLSPQWPTYPSYPIYVPRAFQGRMDEFTLLARPLSPEEIQHQYDVGRPNSSTRSMRLVSRRGSERLPIKESSLIPDPPG